MIDASGRVRVMDFGLARPAAELMDERSSEAARTGTRSLLSTTLTQTGSIMGTPVYMSPEQHMGQPADARSDQFSFCVALWEALYGARPFAGETLHELSWSVTQGQLQAPPRGRAPDWLRRVCARGLSPRPEERFSSMRELVAALERGRGRARARRRAIGLLGVTLVVAGTVAGRRLTRQRALAACAADGDAIASLWPGRRASVEEGVRSVRFSETSLRKLRPWLDRWAARWSSARAEVCVESEVTRALEPALARRALGCLGVQRVHAEGLLEQLERGGVERVRRAVQGAADLPAPEDCVDRYRLERGLWPAEEQLGEVFKLRERLARARARYSAGDYRRGLELVTPLLEEAETLEWAPLHAEINLWTGTLQTELGDHGASEGSLRAAYFEAGSVGASELAADAATTLTRVVGRRLARHDEGLEWGAHADMLIALLGERDDIRDAQLQQNLGLIYRAQGKPELAIEHHERARELRTRILGPEHPSLGAVLNSLGSAEARRGQVDAAIVHYEEAMRLFVSALGEDHPNTASVSNNIGAIEYSRGNLDAAYAAFERARALAQRAFGPSHPLVSDTLNNLGNIEYTRGRKREALRLYREALEINERLYEPDHPDVAISLDQVGFILYELERPRQAIVYHERALAIFETALGPEHPSTGYALSNLGNARARLGEYSRALELHARSVAIAAREGEEHPNVAIALESMAEVYLASGEPAKALSTIERALAIYARHAGAQEAEPAAHFALARALIQTGGDRARALESAETARRLWKDAGDPAEVAKATAWLRDHAAPD